MQGKKLVKRIIIIVLIVAVLAGAAFGGYSVYRSKNNKEAYVYSVAEFSTDYSWGDVNETYGSVTTDKIQSVYISSTQKVTEVYVVEGQRMEVGDPILAYDTTLSDIELQRASISLQKLKLQLDDAKEELKTINTYTPYYPVTPTPAPTKDPSELVSVETPYLVGGSGTMDDPLVYVWNSTDEYTDEFVTRMLLDKENAAVETEPTEEASDDEAEDEPEAEPVEDNAVYATFVVREANSLKGDVQDYWGIKFRKQATGFTFRLIEAVLPDEPSDDEDGNDGGSSYSGPTYTATEIAQMKLEKTQEITELDLSIRQAEVEYARMEKEVSDGVVRCEISGVVKSVIDPDEARGSGDPVVQVSGGGGYYVEGTVGELMLDTVYPGQTVTVQSWESGGTYEGTVVEVSDYPAQNSDSWSSGNSNVSYYPFKVFIDESAELKEWEYVSVQYGSDTDSASKLYLENMFILTDGGKSYVYVRNSDGLLEKREISTGRDLWGSYLEIKSGLTADDWVAFPYGKEIKAGAKTVEGSYDTLYGTYY